MIFNETSNVHDLRRKSNDILNTVSYLDNCIFVAHDDDPDRNRIISLHKTGQAVFVLPKSVRDEVNHPHTPEAVIEKAIGIFFTFPVRPSSHEEKQRILVEEILIGNGKRDKYIADATHVLEAGIHNGYFITTDKRIIAKKDSLNAACAFKSLLHPHG